MGLAQLALPFRLSTMGIEGGAKRIGVSGLLAAFMLHSEKQFVIGAKDLVIAAHNQVIIGGLRCPALQLIGTRVSWPKGDSRQAGYVGTTSTCKRVLRACRPWSRIPDAEQLVVKRHRSGADTVQVGDHCIFELLSRQVDRKERRNHQANAFIVDKEEGFVFPDWSPKRGCVLIGIHERARVDLTPSNGVRLIPKIVVGIQSPAIPPVLCIPVEGVSAGLRDVVNIRSRQPSELPAVAVGHYTGFLDIIQTQG